MHDEYDGRIWAEHHGAILEAATDLLRQIRIAFERLNALQFNAPWNNERRRKAAAR